MTNLGTNTITANSVISLTLTLTNAWTDSAFNTNAIVVQICSSDNTYLSQGTVAMSTLNNATSFTPTTVNNLAVSESNLLAGGSNNVSLTFTINVPTPTGTTFLLMLPKSSYSMNLASISASTAPSSSS